MKTAFDEPTTAGAGDDTTGVNDPPPPKKNHKNNKDISLGETFEEEKKDYDLNDYGDYNKTHF